LHPKAGLALSLYAMRLLAILSHFLITFFGKITTLILYVIAGKTTRLRISAVCEAVKHLLLR